MWLLVFGAGTALVRAGLGLLIGGTVRPRDAAETLLRAIAEVAAAGLAFWAVGAALLFGRGPIVAFDMGLFLSQSSESSGTELFHAIVATIGGAVIAGAIAERARFHVSVVVSAVLGGIVFPVVGHLVWFGWLRQLNVVDFGGAMAVHLSGAVFAAVGVAAVGSRTSWYGGMTVDDNGERKAVAPPVLDYASHSLRVKRTAPAVAYGNLPMVAVGVALVIAGWVPYLMASLLAHPTAFNSVDGDALARTGMNAVLAAAAGGFGGMFYGRTRYGRADLVSAYTGVLGGLVAISAGCVAVGSLGAVMIGLVAGALVPAAAGFMDRRARLDDPAGLIAVHGVGAIWGMLAAAMFAGGQSTMAHFRLVAVQSLAVAMTIAVSAVMAGVTLGLLRVIRPLRVVEA